MIQIAVAAFLGAFACHVVMAELAGASKTARYLGGFALGCLLAVALGLLLEGFVMLLHRVPR